MSMKVSRDKLEYIRNYYEVPAYLDVSVTWRGQEGFINGAEDAHVVIKLKTGEEHILHPEDDDLVYHAEGGYWKKVSAILADYYAASLEHALPLKSVSKGDKRRLWTICKNALSGLEGDDIDQITPSHIKNVIARLKDNIKKYEEANA